MSVRITELRKNDIDNIRECHERLMRILLASPEKGSPNWQSLACTKVILEALVKKAYHVDLAREYKQRHIQAGNTPT